MHVVFLTPHQKPTSGGVHVIESHARELASRHDVTVLVRSGEPRALPGCTVGNFDAAPEVADAVIVPADMDDSGIVAGPRIYFLQGTERNAGFDASPVVCANVSSGKRVIACARWLTDEVARRGGLVEYVPSGLDHRIFRPPRLPRPRPIDLAMLTHDLPSKGTEYGVQALRQVRAVRPDVVIRTFGTVPVAESRVRHLGSLSRRDVAALFRRTKIVISPSLEEGFGLPGLEAMACGAALVTTDSKGPRDYAEDGVNAFVVELAMAERMAASSLLLLGDPRTRRRLSRRGVEAARRVPDWPTASAAFEQAVVRLTQ